MKKPSNVSKLAVAVASIICALPTMAKPLTYQEEIEQIYQQHEGERGFTQFLSPFFMGQTAPIDAQELERKAAAQEKSGDLSSACVNYLLVAKNCLDHGDLEKMKQPLGKIIELRPKLSESAQHALSKSLYVVTINSGRFWRSENNPLAREYFTTQTLLVKESMHENSPEVLTLLLSLAREKQGRQQVTYAVSYYERAAKLLEDGKKTDDQQYLQCLTSLQDLYKLQGDSVQSEACFQKQKTILETLSKAKGSKGVSYLMQLSALYSKSGKNEDSKMLQGKILDDLQQLCQSKDPGDLQEASTVVESLKNSARMQFYGNGPADEVTEQILRLAYKLKVATNGFDMRSMQELSALGHYLCRIGKSNEASSLYKLFLRHVSDSDQKNNIKPQIESLLLEALKKSDDKTELLQLQADLNASRAEQERKSENASEQRLFFARQNKDKDLVGYINAVITLARIRTAQDDQKAAFSLLKESLLEFKQLPSSDSECDDAVAGGVVMFLRKFKLKDDQKIIYDTATILEKRKNDSSASTFVSDAVDFYTENERFADAINFLQSVIKDQRTFHPDNVDEIVRIYQMLGSTYVQSGKKEKNAELHKTITDLLRSKYGPSDPRVICHKLSTAIEDAQGGNVESAEQTADALIAELEKNRSEPSNQDGRSSAEMRNALQNASTQLYQLSTALLNANKLSSADKYMIRSLAFAQQFGVDITYDQIIQVELDRLVQAHLRAHQYSEAEGLLASNLSYISKKSGIDSEQSATCQLKLCDIFRDHGKSLHSAGNSVEGKVLVDKADRLFGDVIAVYKKNLGPNSPIVKDLEQRKNSGKPLSATGSFSVSITQSAPALTAAMPLALSVRHHLDDVADQQMDSPREPLSFAVFGRSEVMLGGQSSTGSYDSSKGFVTEKTGGDIGSCGKIKIADDAHSDGNILGRIICYAQNNIEVSGRVDTSGSVIPDPTPLPAPLSADADLKEVQLENKDGRVGKPESGQIGNLGDFNLPRNASAEILPGDYIANNFILHESSKLTIGKGDGKQKSVRIFLRDTFKPEPGKGPLNLEKNSTLNKDAEPGRLQFWYAGPGTLSFDSGSVAHSIIYAPAALLSIAGEISGSVVADEVRLSEQSKVLYDKHFDFSKIGLPKFKVQTVAAGHTPIERKPGSIQLGSDPDASLMSNAILLMESGEFERAVKAFEAQVKVEEAAETYNCMACCRIGAGQLKQAVDDCTKAIALDPSDVFPYTTRGEAYLRLGQLDKAQPDFKKAVAMVPDTNDPGTMDSLAICYFGLGNTNKAMDLLSKSIAAKPDSWWAYKTRALIYEKLGKKELQTKDIESVNKIIEEFKKKSRIP